MPRKNDPAYKTENSVFATRLRKIMKERGENQTTLADKITSQYVTIQRQTISLYMSGQSRPDTERLTAIAKALNVSADWLLGISEVKAYNAHWRAVCELTGLSDEAARLIIGLSAPRENDPNGRLKNALNAFLSNKKFVSLIMELKTCMVESAKLGAELDHLRSYEDEDIPNDMMELLEYAKAKWGYVWASGERYMGFGAGFDVVDAEEKRGYTLFVLQNIFMEIAKEISEAEIRGYEK